MRPTRTFEALTRIGFAARGLLYVLIGWLTLRTGRPEDGSGALDELAGGAGGLVLAAMALGFFGYGGWRLAEAWVDSEGHGGDARGLAARAAGAVSGLIHLGLGALAVRVALGGRAGGGEAPEQGAATALALPAGELVLFFVAAAVLAAAVYQLLQAYKPRFLRHLDPAAAARRWVGWLGRAGFLARGLVFLVIAWLIGRSAIDARSSEAGGVGDALGSLPMTLRLAVAAGLVLFGLFSLVEARFRRIHAPAIAAKVAGALG